MHWLQFLLLDVENKINTYENNQPLHEDIENYT
jgi:hypothetical protein